MVCKIFNLYPYEHKFKICCENKPFAMVIILKVPHFQLLHRKLELEEYDYEILYKKGRQIINVDNLSRVEI